MDIQWLYEDLVTRGKVLRNVAFVTNRIVKENRGNYRDTWPILPMKLGDENAYVVFTTASYGDTLNDGATSSRSANHKARVPDEMMHIPPRTRFEDVVWVAAWGATFDASVEFTVDTANDELDLLTTDGFEIGDPVQVSTTNTLPAPLRANQRYYVVDKTDLTLKLGLIADGAVINLTTTGTGTHMIMSYKLVGEVRRSLIADWIRVGE